MTTQIVKFELRGDTAANFATTNPVLADREPGWATDTHVLKIGDGATPWNSLPSVGSLGPSILVLNAADPVPGGTASGTIILRRP